MALSATYRPSGASSLEARISSGKTVYDLNSQRDFSGVTGRLAWTWQATGKLVFTTSASRDTGQDSYGTTFFGLPATTDYSRKNTVLQVSSGYAVSSKINITSSVLYYRGDLVRTIANPILPLPLEADGARQGHADRPGRALDAAAQHARWAATSATRTGAAKATWASACEPPPSAATGS